MLTVLHWQSRKWQPVHEQLSGKEAEVYSLCIVLDVDPVVLRILKYAPAICRAKDCLQCRHSSVETFLYDVRRYLSGKH